MADFLPFARPTIDEETIAGVAEVLRSGWIASGPQVQAFEAALSRYLGGERKVRAFTHATGALEVALAVAGVGRGDEVLVPAMTFAATANVVVRLGASVKFVDVELRSRNATAERFAAAIGPRTKALMPVHFAGLALSMAPVHALAKSKGLRVVEDAAHAIGSSDHGRRIGSFGDLVCFSFHPNKNLTTIEGGAIAYGEDALTVAIERARFHGISKDAHGNVDVYMAGSKYNLPDVCARIGLGQLKHLDAWNERRRALAGHYFSRLEGRLPDDWLPERGDGGHSWHLFAPLLPFATLGFSRDEFIARMRARGIGVGVHYPSVPSLTLYRQLGADPADYPNAQRIGEQTVTLPLGPTLTTGDVDRVCDALLDLVGR